VNRREPRRHMLPSMALLRIPYIFITAGPAAGGR